MGYTTIISTPKPSINPNLLQDSYLVCYSNHGNICLLLWSRKRVGEKERERERERWGTLLCRTSVGRLLVLLPVVVYDLGGRETWTWKVGGLDVLFYQQIPWVRCHQTIGFDSFCWLSIVIVNSVRCETPILNKGTSRSQRKWSFLLGTSVPRAGRSIR